MALDGGVIDRDKRLMGASRAFDPRLLAYPLPPLVGADRRVAAPARLRVLPAQREDVWPTAEEPLEKAYLGDSWREVIHPLGEVCRRPEVGPRRRRVGRPGRYAQGLRFRRLMPRAPRRAPSTASGGVQVFPFPRRAWILCHDCSPPDVGDASLCEMRDAERREQGEIPTGVPTFQVNRSDELPRTSAIHALPGAKRIPDDARRFFAVSQAFERTREFHETETDGSSVRVRSSTTTKLLIL